MRLLQIAVLTMCIVCGVAASPTVLYSRPIVVENGPGPQRLVGVDNLSEKSLPVVQSQGPFPLPGTKNLAERVQVDFTKDYRGNANLAEKAIPEEVIAQARIR